MAEMIIRLLGKRNEPFIFGSENDFPFPLLFESLVIASDIFRMHTKLYREDEGRLLLILKNNYRLVQKVKLDKSDEN